MMGRNISLKEEYEKLSLLPLLTWLNELANSIPIMVNDTIANDCQPS